MPKIFNLKGKIQHYAWGGPDFIPDLLQIEKEDKPYAEYWLGAHVNAPSVVTTGLGEQNLDDLIAQDPEEYLGQQVAQEFGRLPFLFKVQEVADILSIQVHPSKTEAEKGFAKENELGIPLTAPNRNYKDDNHKPEILVAISEFWLLHGFLEASKLRKVLVDNPEFEALMPVFEEEGYEGLYKTIMQESAESTNQRISPLAERLLSHKGDHDLSTPEYWASQALAKHQTGADYDKGIYSIFFINIVKVAPGQAVYQDAGIPHAYLRGCNMELMANSDNVLRGGLTPKHVDVPELLKHVTFEETIPNVLDGELQSDGLERIYKSAAPDFEISKIVLKEGEVYQHHAKSMEIMMGIEGEAQLAEGTHEVDLSRGSAVGVKANCDYQIKSLSSAVIYKATAP